MLQVPGLEESCCWKLYSKASAEAPLNRSAKAPQQGISLLAQELVLSRTFHPEALPGPHCSGHSRACTLLILTPRLSSGVHVRPTPCWGLAQLWVASWLSQWPCPAAPGGSPPLLAPKEQPAHAEGSVRGSKTTAKGNKRLTDTCIIQESRS